MADKPNADQPSLNESRIIELTEQAKKLPVEQRDEFLHSQLDGDPDAQSLVREMLANTNGDDPFASVWRFLEQKPTCRADDQPTQDFNTPAANDDTTEFSTGSKFSPLTLTKDATTLPKIKGHRLDAILGSGGMGVVVKAFDEGLEIDVAIKLMQPAKMQSERARTRFLQEARNVAKLRHPHIVGVLREGQTANNTLWFSMELVDGKPLSELVPERGMDCDEAARIIGQVAQALATAHQAKIFHRDIKPANVLIDQNGQARVVDFGLAKNVQSDLSQTIDGHVLGTPQYMAPEQIDSSVGEIGAVTDLYALGGLLYFLLTGQPPHGKSNQYEQFQAVLNQDVLSPCRRRADVDKDLAAICLKCLQREPGRRYASADALIADLQRYADGRPVTARSIGPIGRSIRWAKRNPIAVGVVGMLSTLLLLAGYFWYRAGEHAAIASQRAKQLDEQKTEISNKAHSLAQTNAVMRRQVYGADIRDAFQRLTDDDFAGAFHLACKLIPEPGEEDFRGIEWRLLWHRLVGPYRMLHSPGSYFGHNQKHFSISPDNESLAYTAILGGTFVWNYAEGKLLAHYPEIQIPRHLLDNRSVVCLVNDELAICDASSFKPRMTQPIDGEMRDAFSSPDGKKFGVVIRDGDGNYINVYETSTFEKLFTTARQEAVIRKACFSPDGDELAVAHDDYTFRITDLTDGSITTIKTQFKPIGVDYSSDGHFFVACPLGYRAQIWETKNWTEIASLGGNDKAWRMAKFTPDDRYLIMAGFDGRIWQYETENWTLVSQHDADLTVWWGDISEDGHTLILGGVTGKRNRSEGSSDGGTGLRLFHLDRDFESGFKWHDWGRHIGLSNTGGDRIDSSPASVLTHLSQLENGNKQIEQITCDDAGGSRSKTISLENEAIAVQDFFGGRFTGVLFADGTVGYVDWETLAIHMVETPADARILYRDHTHPDALWIVNDNSVTRFVPSSEAEREQLKTAEFDSLPNVMAIDRMGGQTFIANTETVVALDSKLQERWRHSVKAGTLLAMAAIDKDSVMISTDQQKLQVVERDGVMDWANLLKSATHIGFTDQGTRLLLRDNQRSIDAWDVNTRHRIAKFATADRNQGFEVDWDGKWLMVHTSRTRIFQSPTEQAVLDDLLAMAETENANDIVLNGLERQLRWIGLDDVDVNAGLRLAKQRSRNVNSQRQLDASSEVTWTVRTPDPASLSQHQTAAKDVVQKGIAEMQSKIPDGSIESLWLGQRLHVDELQKEQYARGRRREIFDEFVEQIEPGTRQPLSNLRYHRIAWIDDRTLLAFDRNAIFRLDLLTGERSLVATVPDYVWCAVSDLERGCVYVGTGGTWTAETKSVVSNYPVQLLRFDTATWERETLYQFDEGKILFLALAQDKGSLIATGIGTKGVRVDLDSGEVTTVDAMVNRSAISPIPETNLVVCSNNLWHPIKLVDMSSGQVLRTMKDPHKGNVEYVHPLNGGRFFGFVVPTKLIALMDGETGKFIAKHEIKMQYETHSTGTDDYLLAGIHDGRLFQMFADPNMPTRIFQIGGNRCAGVAMLPGHPDTVVLSTDQGISLMRLPPVD
ncbi:WD40 repeat domain-containing serine/threonine protein kinase [Aporhodopirellula aestuarii]|uniref:WD40 repeat domain-containing serine/threonine protein kinase n=1 Tax=Aporhodopirellula aestuarii TaxID=2950107 RepID=A0ABT0UC63_9BACT|nr:WD40 repeat domain-containing serine/threonine protein kinase [Aporhodopirellula aestuarii]MCM2374080.1 WD40 repeat domain-containing serine/threonine protein kinase [Aporhodopirellula aestuarii]